MKCDLCHKEYSINCDYKQGRCPHHRAIITNILADHYKARFLNLFQTIKNLFSKK